MRTVLFLFSLVCLAACKKGEDDPFLSFRTRKNRVSGNWTLKQGQLTLHTEKASVTTDELYEYDKEQLNYTDVQKGNTLTGISHHLKISFDKKGKFKIEEETAGTQTEVSGTWDFENGVGKGKTKEYINMTITAVGSGKINYLDGFNKSQSNFTYRIKELRNKKMVLVAEQELIDDNSKGPVTIRVDAQYEFEQ